MFRFLPILYRGLGHHFCNCGASLVPLWVPLPLFSSPPDLFYTLPAAARGYQNGGQKEVRKTVEKVIPKKNTRISILHTIYHTSRMSDTPQIHQFWLHVGVQNRSKSGFPQKTSQKVTKNGHSRHQKGPKEPARSLQGASRRS